MLQAKRYPIELPHCFVMGKRTHDHVAEGLAAFSSAARTLMKIRNIDSDAQLAEKVGSKARKTINNALAGRHDAQISTLQAIADALDCPLWAMFLVGSSAADLESPARERLIAVVTDYLKCDVEGRHHVESMASAFAAKTRKSA